MRRGSSLPINSPYCIRRSLSSCGMLSLPPRQSPAAARSLVKPIDQRLRLQLNEQNDDLTRKVLVAVLGSPRVPDWGRFEIGGLSSEGKRRSDLQCSTSSRSSNDLHEASIHGGDTVIEKSKADHEGQSYHQGDEIWQNETQWLRELVDIDSCRFCCADSSIPQVMRDHHGDCHVGKYSLMMSWVMLKEGWEAWEALNCPKAALKRVLSTTVPFWAKRTEHVSKHHNWSNNNRLNTYVHCLQLLHYFE